jgi:hypothetical protein
MRRGGKLLVHAPVAIVINVTAGERISVQLAHIECLNFHNGLVWTRISGAFPWALTSLSRPKPAGNSLAVTTCYTVCSTHYSPNHFNVVLQISEGF